MPTWPSRRRWPMPSLRTASTPSRSSPGLPDALTCRATPGSGSGPSFDTEAHFPWATNDEPRLSARSAPPPSPRMPSPASSAPAWTWHGSTSPTAPATTTPTSTAGCARPPMRQDGRSASSWTCRARRSASAASTAALRCWSRGPGARVSAPALTDKDAEDLRFALALGVDLIALSSVRRPEDAEIVRRAMDAAGRRVPVIAKLEKEEAIDHLTRIVDDRLLLLQLG